MYERSKERKEEGREGKKGDGRPSPGLTGSGGGDEREMICQPALPVSSFLEEDEKGSRRKGSHLEPEKAKSEGVEREGGKSLLLITRTYARSLAWGAGTVELVRTDICDDTGQGSISARRESDRAPGGREAQMKEGGARSGMMVHSQLIRFTRARDWRAGYFGV